MSFKYKDKTLVFYQIKGDQALISARRNDGKVKVNDLLEKACKGLGKAGGHIVAAGATIDKKHLKKFLERIH